jgi:Uma2 family endonuclease
MAMNPVNRLWTFEEYLAYEDETGIKHEFINGEIYAMTGGTFEHGQIANNVGAELRAQVRKTDCRAVNSDVKIKISDEIFVYPDVTVVCGEAKFADTKRTLLTNPTLVVEVLSDSSKNYDKGAKADYYLGLPSLKAYLILEQKRAHTTLYTRHEAGWLRREFKGMGAVVPLEAIGCNLVLSEAYLNIDFEAGEEN